MAGAPDNSASPPRFSRLLNDVRDLRCEAKAEIVSNGLKEIAALNMRQASVWARAYDSEECRRMQDAVFDALGLAGRLKSMEIPRPSFLMRSWSPADVFGAPKDKMILRPSGEITVTMMANSESVVFDSSFVRRRFPFYLPFSVTGEEVKAAVASLLEPEPGEKRRADPEDFRKFLALDGKLSPFFATVKLPPLYKPDIPLQDYDPVFIRERKALELAYKAKLKAAEKTISARTREYWKDPSKPAEDFYSRAMADLRPLMAPPAVRQEGFDYFPRLFVLQKPRFFRKENDR